MKYLLISKAISNGGDYLLTQAGIKLAYRFLGKENCVYINANEDIWKTLDTERFDALLVLGGPLYTNRLLKKESFPLLYKMKNLEKRIYFLGCGCYTINDSPQMIYGEQFDKEVMEMLSYVDSHGVLGCRDYLTVRMLKNNNFNNVLMTGCPAWYGDNLKKRKLPDVIKNIAFSDAGLTKSEECASEKHVQTVSVLQLIKRKFPDAHLIYTFNNGIKTKLSAGFNLKMADYLKNMGIIFYDLSYSADKFQIYDTCDLHIGYRLHSHIYALSRQCPSILICEDARGIGFNRVFGLEIVKAFSEDSSERYKNNPYLLKCLDNIISEQIEKKFYDYWHITDRMKYYYEHNLCYFFDLICGGR